MSCLMSKLRPTKLTLVWPPFFSSTVEKNANICVNVPQWNSLNAELLQFAKKIIKTCGVQKDTIQGFQTPCQCHFYKQACWVHSFFSDRNELKTLLKSPFGRHLMFKSWRALNVSNDEEDSKNECQQNHSRGYHISKLIQLACIRKKNWSPMMIFLCALNKDDLRQNKSHYVQHPCKVMCVKFKGLTPTCPK